MRKGFLDLNVRSNL